jgi:hypothetical protein
LKGKSSRRKRGTFSPVNNTPTRSVFLTIHKGCVGICKPLLNARPGRVSIGAGPTESRSATAKPCVSCLADHRATGPHALTCWSPGRPPTTPSASLPTGTFFLYESQFDIYIQSFRSPFPTLIISDNPQNAKRCIACPPGPKHYCRFIYAYVFCFALILCHWH